MKLQGNTSSCGSNGRRFKLQHRLRIAHALPLLAARCIALVPLLARRQALPEALHNCWRAIDGNDIIVSHKGFCTQWATVIGCLHHGRDDFTFIATPEATEKKCCEQALKVIANGAM